MNWFSGIVVYLLIWWVVLFTVLPWKNRPSSEPVTGHATSAPKTPNLGVKFVATSVISGILWIVVFLLIDHKIIDYRESAMQMMREDQAQ